jgi:hypothetical protein
VFGSTAWRRIFIAAGFSLSLAASGLAGAAPAWAWLLPLAALRELHREYPQARLSGLEWSWPR